MTIFGRYVTIHRNRSYEWWGKDHHLWFVDYRLGPILVRAWA